MRARSQTLKKKAFQRDNFTCQKCKIQDKTAKILEAHHITPLYLEGKNELDNIITLCFDCHHFAPNSKEEFDEYTKEEINGTATIFLKSWEKVRKEHPELIEEINKVQEKLGNNSV